jgi:hypothetical protein
MSQSVLHAPPDEFVFGPAAGSLVRAISSISIYRTERVAVAAVNALKRLHDVCDCDVQLQCLTNLVCIHRLSLKRQMDAFIQSCQQSKRFFTGIAVGPSTSF